MLLSSWSHKEGTDAIAYTIMTPPPHTHTHINHRFGLGVAEAMAAGLSVITTDKGAAVDFTSSETVWQVSSEFIDCKQYPCDKGGKPRVFGLPTGNMPQWLDYNTSDLGYTMRRVYEQPALAKTKARAAQRWALRLD